uniref:Secreted protein n=1 Tax=Steinernema glaseri TaxID=37863 RepID=A0A1I7Z2A8_9BILA
MCHQGKFLTLPLMTTLAQSDPSHQRPLGGDNARAGQKKMPYDCSNCREAQLTLRAPSRSFCVIRLIGQCVVNGLLDEWTVLDEGARRKHPCGT